ncbi:MAG TPA: 1-(5-phosphoribosyl)-5-[(5-phosphoribosylamino)methylideneamino]imidazole-4-carboxamide isomerase [Nitrospirota bacterium]|nr:1-(5-phosphoribosyl)-5-[(5-phosphoribosylamino)methylideneamino]imidazole-4-carboxamide isomerase [Nitrospirota bacterium]
MIVIPAIDLKEGKCVRLLQGRMEDATVYSDSPAGTAAGFEALGAELLHVVDLDGAFAGSPKNLDSIKAILGAVRIPIEVGGGVRDMNTIEMLLSLGVSRVILGTAALEVPGLLVLACKKYPGRIVAGIDAKDGRVAVRGWGDVSKVMVDELAGKMEDAGVRAIIYTDISRDGMLTGHNVEATRRLAGQVKVPIIASGGVKDISDIKALMEIEALGVEGVITGKAVYAGTLDLKEAIALTKGAAK